MAVAASQLLTGGSSSAASSYTTPSITPTANRLCLVVVKNKQTNPAIPFVSGAGMVWDMLFTGTNASDQRITVFRAMSASPSAGALTIEFTGQTQSDNTFWSVTEFSGVEQGANGANACVQAVMNYVASGTTLALSMANFSDVDNATFGCAVEYGTGTMTKGANFTQLANTLVTGGIILPEFAATNQTTVDWTWSGATTCVGIAVEIKAAGNERQRTLRSDDTHPLPGKYFAGEDSAETISTGTDAPIDSACTGIGKSTSLVATNASFVAGQLILIHQTIGVGADASPNHEYNVIDSYTTGTITLKYPLTKTFNTGAQVLVILRRSTITFTTSNTLSAKAWNGTVGGIIARLARRTIGGTGTFFLKGKGYRGGAASVGGGSLPGEGTSGVYPGNSGVKGGSNGNGAGRANSSGGTGDAGELTAGGTGAKGTSTEGGVAKGDADLRSIVLGGGGSSGENSNSSVGGIGGAILILIAPDIDMTNITVNLGGDAGGNSSGGQNNGAGGGGASCGSLKGNNVILGSLMTAAGGAGGTGSSQNGGVGGSGRFNVDYGTSLTGGTTPAANTRQDSSLVPGGGGFMMFF